MPAAYLYNAASETVETGGYFKMSLVHTTGGFGERAHGVAVKHPGWYRIDLQAAAAQAGTYTVQVCLDETPVTEGGLGCTCGTQLGGFLMVQVADTPQIIGLRNSGAPMTTLPGTSAPALSMFITGYDIWVRDQFLRDNGEGWPGHPTRFGCGGCGME